MSLLFQTRGGTFEQRWIYYAMFATTCSTTWRAASGEAFSARSTPSRACSAPAGRRAAAKSMASSRAQRDEVLALPMSERVRGEPRTNAVISVAGPLPERRDTMLIRDASSTHIPIDPSMKTLGDAFGHMVESLLRLTEGAADDDVVEVFDVRTRGACAHEPPARRPIAHYRALARLGAGGGGGLPLRRRAPGPRGGFVKVMPDAQLHDARAIARFRREARVGSGSRTRTSARCTTPGPSRARLHRHGASTARRSRDSSPSARCPLPACSSSRSRSPTRSRRRTSGTSSTAT